MAIINSNQISFVDITDSRKLDVYISSNLPTTQIFNSNTQTYSPDWRTTNLKLTADVYLDSEQIVPEKVEWFIRTGVGSTETLIGTDLALTIATNKLSENPIVTYKCRAEYQNIASFQEITFTRVDTGLNGANGNSAPAVQAQYSVDGSSWSPTLNSNTHKYIRFSYDNGATWTTAIKMTGEDGTSVTITGTAYYNGTLSDGHIGQNVVLYSDTSFTTVVNTSHLNTGDAYIVQGYLCVYNKASNAFICTGMIQGPRGTAGTSSYIFIRYATDANGANISDNPSGKSYIGFYTSSVNSAPTDVRLYTWQKFVGDNAKSIVLSGDSQVFKVNKTNVITPEIITVTAQTINTTIPDSGWTYSINGGQTFLSTVPAGVVRNGSIVTVTGSNMTSNSIVIKASDGTYFDVFTVYKAFDGTDGTPGNPGAPAPIAFLTNENISFSANANGQIATTTFTTSVVAYNGTTKVTPTIGTITGLPTGMTVGTPTTTANEIILTFSIANNSTLGVVTSTNGTITIPITSPVSTNLKLSWSKINTGASGTDAYTVFLTNESHTFAGDISKAMAGSTTAQVYAYKGSAIQTATIVSVNGVAASTSDTETGIDGLKFKCSAISGTAPIITFTCTTAFVSSNGTIPIVISVGGVSFTKLFTYAIAFKGATGTPASLVDITPSALYFKSTTGQGGIFTPTYIYLYPRFQNATYNGWQYSLDGGNTWVAVTNANGLSVGTYSSVANTLRITNTSSLYTDTITSISFRCNSTTSGVYDTVSIAKIYDVVDLKIGGRNLLLDSGTPITNSTYNIKNYNLSLTPTVGEQYTLTVKGTLGTGKTHFAAYNSGGSVSFGALTRIGTSDLHTVTFLWTNGGQTTLDKSVNIYAMPNATVAESTIQWIKLEKGNKATDWSPAPEDVSANINKVDTRLTSSLAEVKTTTDSISSRVSATESSVSALTTRVSSAEQQITPTAIVSTVRSSTDYTNDLGKKVGTNEIISKINQTAESVTISANKIGLLGATNIPDLTADKIKGGTLTLGGTNAQTQNGQILVKNSSNEDMISINQYGMAIADGNLVIVDESEINEYGGWSSYSHNQLKTTGMTSMYIARNSSAEYHAELDAISGLTMKCLGGMNANPYYLHMGPTDGVDDDGSQITFTQKLRFADGMVSSGTTSGNVVADISLNEVVLPKANIILQDTAQKNIAFQNASKELRACMLYAGANDSTTVMGAWDTTKSKSIFTYSTDNKFYILDSEAVTKSMMQSSVGERGYQKLPSGLIIQWGYQGSALTVSGNYNLTSGNITLPIAFPNSFTGVFCNIIEADNGTLSGYYNITAKSNGLTGFTWKTYNYWNNWGSSILFSWMAIGY